MKQLNIKFCLVGVRSIGSVLICLALSLSGCMSIPTSPTPKFYMLSAINKDQVTKILKISPNVIIGIGPVKIPEYLNRPQIVTINKDKLLQFAQFDRWGESLDLGLARLVREDLVLMLPAAKLTLYPWNPNTAVKYQVTLEVVLLDSEIDKDMHFVVQWSIIDQQDMKTLLIKRSEFRTAISPQNYAGLVNTLSTNCSSLSDQIAQAITSLKSV